MSEYIDTILKAAPLIALAIATFFGLKLKPIEQDIKRNSDENRKTSEELCQLEHRLEQHLRDTIEDFHNFDRWRGQVTALLESNHVDHKEMKESLREMRTEIRKGNA